MNTELSLSQEEIDHRRLSVLVEDARKVINKIGRLGTISERMEEALHWAAGVTPQRATTIDPEVEGALVHLRSVRLAIRLHISQHDNFWKSVSAVLAAMVGIIAKDVQDAKWMRAIQFSIPAMLLALVAYFIAGNVARWKEVIGGLDTAITSLEKVLDALSKAKAPAAPKPAAAP